MLAILTFIVFLFNAITFAQQCKIMKQTLPVITDQAAAAKIQAAAAKIQAEANRLQADAAARSATLAQRALAPDVYVSELTYTDAEVAVVFANLGRSVARQVRTDIDYLINPSPGDGDPCVVRYSLRCQAAA